MARKERYVGVEEARAQLGLIATTVARGGAPVIITKRGRPLAVLINLERFEQMKRDVP